MVKNGKPEMKRALLIISLMLWIVAFSANGCVSLKKHNELKDRNAGLEKESAELKQRNASLAEENARLKTEVSQFRGGAEVFYKQGIMSYEQGDLYDAIDQFEKLLDRYPGDTRAAPAHEKVAEIKALSARNYQKILKSADGIKDLKGKIDYLDKEADETFLTATDLDRLSQKREAYAADYKLLDEASKHIIIEDDPTRSVRFYRTTRFVGQHIGSDKSFFVEIYAVQHYAGKKDLRIRTRYVGNSWISYDTVSLRGDGVQVEVICKYPEKLSNMSGDRIYEWSDNDVDDEKMIRMFKGPITVRFSGGYKYTLVMNDEQMLAFREMIRKFQTLK